MEKLRSFIIATTTTTLSLGTFERIEKELTSISLQGEEKKKEKTPEEEEQIRLFHEEKEKHREQLRIAEETKLALRLQGISTKSKSCSFTKKDFHDLIGTINSFTTDTELRAIMRKIPDKYYKLISPDSLLGQYAVKKGLIGLGGTTLDFFRTYDQSRTKAGCHYEMDGAHSRVGAEAAVHFAQNYASK